MDSREGYTDGQVLRTFGFVVFAIVSITCSTKAAHSRIDELEEYVNVVEMYRSQDRAELNSLKEDLYGPKESVKPNRP